MSANSDQNYIDACKIVEAYERAVRYEANELSILMMMESNLDFMDEILDSSQSALNEMDIIENEDANQDVQIDLDQFEEGDVLAQNKEQNSCAEDKPFAAMQGSTLVFSNEGQTAELDASLPLVDPVNAIDKFFGGDGEITAEDIKANASECFGCDLKVEFDFQIKPINFLSELLPLLNKINAMLNNLINELKPFDLLTYYFYLNKSF